MSQSAVNQGLTAFLIRLLFKRKQKMKGIKIVENKNNSSKVPYTGLGLIFGTAIGAGISIAIGEPILWAGVGTGIGLVLGAIIDSKKKE